MRPITGRAFKYGDHINTDLIIQTQYLSSDRIEMGRHCLENLDPSFASQASQGDILIAGVNFGCGSTKPGALALLGAGIECVIAVSFGRIFFRNAINSGLLVIEDAALAHSIQNGDRLSVDFEEGICENHTQRYTMHLPEYPELIRRIISCGGIIQYVNQYESL